MDTALVVVILSIAALHLAALVGGGVALGIVRLLRRGGDGVSEAKG